jgi:hypothetical protein
VTQNTVPPSDAETEAQLLDELPRIRAKVDRLDRFADPDCMQAAHDLAVALRSRLGIDR